MSILNGSGRRGLISLPFGKGFEVLVPAPTEVPYVVEEAEDGATLATNYISGEPVSLWLHSHLHDLILLNTPLNFHAGQIELSLPLWQELSDDPWVTDTVLGKFFFSFHDLPQCQVPPLLHFSWKDTQALNAAMAVFIHDHIVERATPGFSGYCSTFFPRLQ